MDGQVLPPFAVLEQVLPPFAMVEQVLAPFAVGEQVLAPLRRGLLLSDEVGLPLIWACAGCQADDAPYRTSVKATTAAAALPCHAMLGRYSVLRAVWCLLLAGFWVF